MMFKFVVLLACVWMSVAEKRAVQPIDAYSLDSFLKVFRESTLDKIASEWNVTIAQAEVLHTQMIACNQNIQTAVNECINCTDKICQHRPPVAEFLHQTNPVDALKQPLTDVGASLDDVMKLLGTKSFGFLDAMKGITIEGVNSLGDGLEFFDAVFASKGYPFKNIFDFTTAGDWDCVAAVERLPALHYSTAFVGLGHGLNDLGKMTIDGLGDLGNFAVDGLTDIGQSIGNGFKDAGESIVDGLSSIFGRRKRYLDSVDIECMNRCDNDCWKLMTNDNSVMLTNVCGAMVVALNTTVHSSIDKVTTLYNATLDTRTPIISQIEIDTSTINSNMEVPVVYVTANIKGKRVRYQSGVPYKMMDIPTTAKQMAQELWNRWY